MTDQTIPADDVRALLDHWRRDIKRADDLVGHYVAQVMTHCANQLEDLIPELPRSTLADMTYEEKLACCGMQADVEGDPDLHVILNIRSIGWAEMAERNLNTRFVPPQSVTPRPDLPRLQWPGSEPEEP